MAAPDAAAAAAGNLRGGVKQPLEGKTAGWALDVEQLRVSRLPVPPLPHISPTSVPRCSPVILGNRGECVGAALPRSLRSVKCHMYLHYYIHTHQTSDVARLRRGIGSCGRR